DVAHSDADRFTSPGEPGRLSRGRDGARSRGPRIGIYDRDYCPESTRRWWTNWGDRQVTLWLVGIMVGVFVIQVVTRAQAGGADRGGLTEWADYSLPAILEGQVWRLFTWQFLHEPFGFWHVAFTLFCLYFIGTELE